MQDLLEYIVKNLTKKPEDIEIEEVIDGNFANLKLKVNQEDMGIVIGKSGQTIKAIRKLLVSRAMADNNNLRVNLELIDQNPQT